MIVSFSFTQSINNKKFNSTNAEEFTIKNNNRTTQTKILLKEKCMKNW